ncbi:hypothetical protein [Caulobacter endophyticus]|uniref:hypothetical protein n=1 Tax=Caulobacter endophyticus TaxID=2172652 RepID=UPI0013049153|nr:hypothetical protein [Caulobacter endophyticus]
MSDDIALALTEDEALVLFEWLSDFEAADLGAGRTDGDRQPGRGAGKAAHSAVRGGL